MTQRLAVLGGQWGDEGKGKIVDWLSEHFKIIVRCQGGANAGHTVKIGDDTYAFHLLPSGLLRKDRTGIVGNGVVLCPITFFREIDQYETKQLSLKGRLFVSDRAHVVFPYHRTMDGLRENSSLLKKIGTTKRGIGPAYEDKAARRGIRVGTFREPEILRSMIHENVEQMNRLFAMAGHDTLDAGEVYEEYASYAQRMLPFIADTSKMLSEATESILFEGAQGALLDIDHGTYPFVTSSNSSVGGIMSGSGVPPQKLDRTVGVFKSYSTRVGEGPFISELKDDIGDRIRKQGNEFGTTTGRPRRCGWFDAVAAAYSARINGFTDIALTLLDVLEGFDEVKICTAYKYKNSQLTDFPSDAWVLDQCTPVYTTFPGWKEGVRSVQNFDELPSKAKDYVKRLEDLMRADITLVSTGPARRETIVRRSFEF